jgi:tetratricopeptide (TPR) repeat protein
MLAAVVLASSAHAYSSYRRHQSAAAHCARGESAWCHGRMIEAEREFAAALRIDPNLFAARDQLAVVAWQQGDRDRSLALLREGVRLAPESFDAHRSLGETLFLIRDYAGAIPILEQAERLQPTEPGKPSLLKTCREALVNPPKGAQKLGPWTGLRTHATIQSTGSEHHDGDTDCAHCTSKRSSQEPGQ